MPRPDDPTTVAQRWAEAAGVRIEEEAGMTGLRAVSGLLESVWGRSAEGVPLSSEVLRSLAHAGGATLTAYDGERLVGAACLTPAARGAYGLIAAVVPGLGDRGIGLALKQAQRAWALAHGFDTITWTFDPLVGRNARFNLVRLGATATAYDVAFYGRMDDDVNGDDEADRLVATWALTSERAVRAAAGAWPTDPEPPAQVGPVGPDGDPMVRAGAWVRIPRDIVALRRTDPAQASAWRLAVRDHLGTALARGEAVHLTRDGWYVVEPTA